MGRPIQENHCEIKSFQTLFRAVNDMVSFFSYTELGVAVEPRFERKDFGEASDFGRFAEEF
jgi:hypothetical protein